MDPEEDYFGNVVVPDGPEEDDATNDVTFGDTSDIIAGDPDSDAVWKSNHETLAQEIQREKEALLNRQEHVVHVSQEPRSNFMPLDPVAQQYQLQLQHQQAMLQAHQLQHARLAPNPDMQQLNPLYMHQLQYSQQQAFVQQQQAMAEQQRRLFMAQQYAQQQQHQMLLAHREQQNQSEVPATTLSTAQYLPIEGKGHVSRDSRNGPGQAAIPVGAVALGDLERQMDARPSRPMKEHHVDPSRFPRMEEIERQMAAAGLGPGAEHHSDRDALDSATGRSSDQSSRGTGRARIPGSTVPTGKKCARLESMSDRDLELVLRIHLRQLETTVPYKDDYYAYALRDRDTRGNPDTFSALASQVSGMNDLVLRHPNRKKGGPKGARPLAKSGQNLDDISGSIGSSSSHVPGHISTLTNALGSLQVWNPKAPRKLVDFGIKPTAVKSSSVNKNSSGLDGSNPDLDAFASRGPTKLLRDDESIEVRAAVEEGYDVIAAIHDVARRKNTVPLEPLISNLFGLFKLSVAEQSGYQAPGTSDSDSFFVRMCGFAKGKLFVSRAVSLLKPSHKKETMFCLMRHLSTLVESERNLHKNNEYCEPFWATLSEIVGSSLVDSLAVIAMLGSFHESHRDHPGTIVSVLGTSLGSRLIYSILERIFGDINGGQLEADDPVLKKTMDMFFDGVTESLGDIFDLAAFSTSAGVWQICALLDALANQEQQGRLRSLLKQLLEEGRAPAPPA
jgi:hypothetical protein